MEHIASGYVEFKCRSYCTTEEHGKEKKRWKQTI